MEEELFFPKTPLYTQTSFQFQFRRVQFPIKVCFTMTINKTQGWILAHGGTDLESNCFPHRRLYVVFFRVGRPSTIYTF